MFLALNACEGVQLQLQELDVNKKQNSPVIEKKKKAFNSLNHKKRAKNELLKGNYDYALMELDLAIIENPKDVEPVFDKGLVHYFLKQLETALTSFNKAISIDPTYHKAYFYKGKVLTDMNRTLEAIQTYQQAVQLNPENAVSHFNLAELFNNDKDIENDKNAEDSMMSAYIIWKEKLSYNPSYFVQNQEMGKAFKKVRKKLRKSGKIKSVDYKNLTDTLNPQK
ncbi:hypothetical protein BVY03_01930 [bacterium K02(2017)]|nr:hypothetical protein BVY03_01930 [bacterium K02(2017)]